MAVFTFIMWKSGKENGKNVDEQLDEMQVRIVAMKPGD